MVSDLLEVAQRRQSPDELASRSAHFPTHARAPVVVWNVCRHCNMKCPHCYAAATTTSAQNDMDTMEAIGVLETLAQGGVKVVIFSGGEPLLRRDIVELITHATKLGIAPHLSSNGSLIDVGVASRLKAAGLAYVGVSLDGTAQFNDTYRGMTGGFRLAVRALKACREVGIRTGVRLTLTRRNASQVNAVLSVARRHGAARFYVSHLVYAGRALRLLDDDLSPSESRSALLALFHLGEELLSMGESIRLVSGGNDSAGVFLLRYVEERYGREAGARIRRLLALRGGNSAGQGILAVDSRGRVHPDQFWRGVTLGNLRRQSVAEVLASPVASALRDRVSRLTGRCGTCAYQDLCRGSHRERALAAHGDMWAPDPACVLEDAEIQRAAPGTDAPSARR